MCILVVEDEPIIREFMVEAIAEAGFEVREACTGDVALGMLDGLSPPLSLLFTDVHMPGQTDGIALARHVRQSFPEVPIVFTTGRPDLLATEAQFTQLHAFLHKPYKPAQLVGMVELLLGKQALKSSTPPS